MFAAAATRRRMTGVTEVTALSEEGVALDSVLLWLLALLALPEEPLDGSLELLVRSPEVSKGSDKTTTGMGSEHTPWAFFSYPRPPPPCA